MHQEKRTSLMSSKAKDFAQRLHQLVQANLLRGPPEGVAALDAAVAEDVALAAQHLEDVRHKRPADTETIGNLTGAATLRPMVQEGEDQERISTLRLSSVMVHPLTAWAVK